MKPADLYILEQAEPYRSILFHLQAVVEHTIPELALQYKWKLPYYYLHEKPFCYFNVNVKKKFVDVGFSKGFQLTKCLDHLVSEKRSTIKSLRYFSQEAIDNDILKEVLQDLRKYYL